MRTILALLPICLTTSLQALYLSNPSAPQLIEKGMFLSEDCAFGLKVGYQGDFVFDRNLKIRGEPGGRIDSFQIFNNFGVLTFSLFDRFELYATLGAADIEFAHRPSVDHQKRDYDFHNQFAWGGGARILIFQWDAVCFGLNANYEQAKPDMQWSTLNGVSITPQGALKYQEWQIGIGLSYETDLLTPYIGADYSHVRAQLQHTNPDLDLVAPSFVMSSREHFGMVVGCSVCNSQIADLTVELKFFDEQSLTIAGNLKF